jgi:dTDP-glucose 4,6-dehydratase
MELTRSPFVKKFVQVSSDEVYGSLPLNSKKKFTEHSPLTPTSPYSSSKASSDFVAHSFFKTYGSPVVITRCSNNYGPNQYPEKLIPFSIVRLLEGKPITIYGDGLNVRDWIHVDDHNAALILALIHGVPGEIYNIGADDEVDNLTLARRLLAYFKKDDSAIVYVKDRPGHDHRYAIDASKIKRELGWKPRHSFNSSFVPTIEWYIKNTQWMKKARIKGAQANIHI